MAPCGRPGAIGLSRDPAGNPSVLSEEQGSDHASGESVALLLVSKDSPPPYDRPPLSKDFLRGESSVGDLPLADPGFHRDQRIDVMVSTEVVELEPGRREATTDSGRVILYHQCVLATGCAPAEMASRVLHRRLR